MYKKRTWQGINNLLNRCKRKRKSVGKLKDPDNNNNLTNDSSRIPNILNKHFSNVGNILASKLPPAERSFIDYLRNSSSPELSFFFKPVTPSEIQFQFYLYQTANRIAYTPVLVNFLNTQAKSFPQFFQTFSIHLSLGVYPQKRKMSKIIPYLQS